jgi:hypothetical protein
VLAAAVVLAAAAAVSGRQAGLVAAVHGELVGGQGSVG